MSKKVDKKKVDEFVNWFLNHEERIRKSVENSKNDKETMYTVLDEVELELAKVYRDGYRGDIEFDYGGKGQDWELNLYHKNNMFLRQATSMIANELRDKCKEMWKFNTGR